LGDLGRVPARYDMAVSTACTNLDVIVCDNTEGAKSCINFLREGKVGRATFVALDKIQNFGPKMDNIPSVPRGSQRLFDLIDTDVSMDMLLLNAVSLVMRFNDCVV
jgi:structural maintenance of chromosome 4